MNRINWYIAIFLVLILAMALAPRAGGVSVSPLATPTIQSPLATPTMPTKTPTPNASATRFWQQTPTANTVVDFRAKSNPLGAFLRWLGLR